MLQPNPLALSLLIPVLISGWLIFYAWRRHSITGAAEFIFCMAALAIWSIGYGFELASTDLTTMLSFIRLEYLAIPTLPVLLLILVLRYTGKETLLTKRNIAYLFILPIITIVINYTNQFHHLFYADVGVDNTGPFPLLIITSGPWYWVHIVYSYLAITAGIYFLLQWLRNSSHKYKEQAVAMLVALLIPWIVDILYLMGLRPYEHVDMTPFAFTVTGMVMAWGIFRHQLFDIVPIAREQIVENMNDGVVVLDSHDRLVDYNSSSTRIFDWTVSPVGKPLTEIWGNCPEILRLCQSQEETSVEIKKDSTNHEIKYYEISVSSLSNYQGQFAGKILIIHDVTQHKRLEETLRKLSITDELTQLYNRHGFYTMAKQQISLSNRTGEKLFLMYIDLDDLKEINDRFGHLQGDLVLKDIAEVLLKTFRKSDVIARVGGDEFIVLTSCHNEEDVKKSVIRLRQNLDDHFLRNTSKHKSSLSIGISTYDPEHPSSVDELINLADTKMYLQKLNKNGSGN